MNRTKLISKCSWYVVFLILSCVSMLFLACNKAGGKSSGAASISVEVFDRGTDGGKTNPADNEWTKWIKEKLLKDENIDITFVPVSRWEEGSILTNLMAAGTVPDVCATYSQANITNWSGQGGVFDMAPYVDTTLKDMNEFLGEDRALKGRRLINRLKDAKTGALYSVPSKRASVALRNTFIRKDWLDKLGLPLPSTLQEYYDALAAFKEKDPGGVGKNKVIPFTMTTDIRWEGANIMDSFIDPALSRKERWIHTVSERNFAIPGYKEGVRFMNKMYNAGLIDRDFPLYRATGDNNNLIKSGVVGSIVANWDYIYRDAENVLRDLIKNVPTAEFVPVDCMTGSDGMTHKNSYDMVALFLFIPASSKNPDAAMRYINWLAKPENSYFIQTGPEGIVHTIVDGIPKIDAFAAKDPKWIQNSPGNVDYALPMMGLFIGSEEKNVQAFAAGFTWPPDVITHAYNVAMINAEPPIVISPSSPLVAEGPLNQTLVDKGVALYTQSITCAPGDFDRIYNAGLKDWLDSGAQKIIDERREKYVEP
jgi:putative aldouronate transport system substrate-binding protein